MLASAPQFPRRCCGLARLAGERTAWQIKGRKGQRDGRGYMDMKSTQPHPLPMPRR